MSVFVAARAADSSASTSVVARPLLTSRRLLLDPSLREALGSGSGAIEAIVRDGRGAAGVGADASDGSTLLPRRISTGAAGVVSQSNGDVCVGADAGAEYRAFCAMEILVCAADATALASVPTDGQSGLKPPDAWLAGIAVFRRRFMAKFSNCAWLLKLAKQRPADAIMSEFFSTTVLQAGCSWSKHCFGTEYSLMFKSAIACTFAEGFETASASWSVPTSAVISEDATLPAGPTDSASVILNSPLFRRKPSSRS